MQTLLPTWNKSSRDQKLLKIAIFPNFQQEFIQTTYFLEFFFYKLYENSWGKTYILRESAFKTSFIMVAWSRKSKKKYRKVGYNKKKKKGLFVPLI